jgi:hypothetical protein
MQALLFCNYELAYKYFFKSVNDFKTGNPL